MCCLLLLRSQTILNAMMIHWWITLMKLRKIVMCVSPDEDGFNKDKHLKVVNYERIGPPTDMWGVGVICYILLSGSTHILFSSCIVLQINHMILLCHCSKSSSYLFQEIFRFFHIINFLIWRLLTFHHGGNWCWWSSSTSYVHHICCHLVIIP